MKLRESHQSFGGKVEFWEHSSKITQTLMRFSAYTPPQTPLGAIIWLSGLTCTEENFMVKAGAQIHLAQHSLLTICPDTSPRGLNLPGEHETSDFGSGAGFYLDATTPGYRGHYRMASYVMQEILPLLVDHFKIAQDKISLMGHSMGGHGALTLGLKNPAHFRSLSAFAPIVNPTQCPWGQKAFLGYLGEDQSKWLEYDACALISEGKSHPQKILIDQGLADGFLEEQRLTRPFEEICKQKGQACEVRYQIGYDHSYYFIASFIRDHIKYHANILKTP